MNIVGVTGHQNIPEEAMGFVKAKIADTLGRFNGAFVGVSSLAAGADQLFAQAVLRAGGDLHIVIPCHGYEATFEKLEDLQSFRRLLKRADVIETLEYDRPSEDAYLAAGHRIVEQSDVLVAVWDGLEARGKGGTADIVRYARERGKDILVIWPTGIVR